MKCGKCGDRLIGNEPHTWHCFMCPNEAQKFAIVCRQHRMMNGWIYDQARFYFWRAVR